MKTLFGFIALLLLASSCRTIHHQYIVVDNHNLPKNENRQFVEEKENIRVTYSFGGQDMPFIIKVENLSDKGAFIDWNKSALVFNGRTLQVRNPEHRRDITSPYTTGVDADGYVSTRRPDKVPIQSTFMPSGGSHVFRVCYFPQWQTDPSDFRDIPKTDEHHLYADFNTSQGYRYESDGARANPKIRFVMGIDKEQDNSITFDQTFDVTAQYRIKRKHDDTAYKRIKHGDRGYYVHARSNGVTEVLLVGTLVGVFLLAFGN